MKNLSCSLNTASAFNLNGSRFIYFENPGENKDIQKSEKKEDPKENKEEVAKAAQERVDAGKKMMEDMEAKMKGEKKQQYLKEKEAILKYSRDGVPASSIAKAGTLGDVELTVFRQQVADEDTRKSIISVIAGVDRLESELKKEPERQESGLLKSVGRTVQLGIIAYREKEDSNDNRVAQK